jgi:hypothetical protein
MPKTEMEVSEVRAEVVESMARTIFVLAWISCEEDKPGGESWLSDNDDLTDEEYAGMPDSARAFGGRSLMGVDLMDIAPDKGDADARYELGFKQADWYAEQLACKIERAQTEGGWWQWAGKADALDDLDGWGHYQVMPIVGHGVAWTDSHEDNGMDIDNLNLELNGYDGDEGQDPFEIDACGYLPWYGETT